LFYVFKQGIKEGIKDKCFEGIRDNNKGYGTHAAFFVPVFTIQLEKGTKKNFFTLVTLEG
jgi:hypothetical protein